MKESEDEGHERAERTENRYDFSGVRKKQMAEYKKTGRCKVLCVTGCLAQRYRDDLLRDIPEIDCLLGVSQYSHLIEYLEKTLAG